MIASKLPRHVCPACRSSDLSPTAQTCAATNDTESFGFQWKLHARTRLESYSRISVSQARLRAAFDARSHLRGRRVPEDGSGADDATFDMYSPEHDHPHSLASITHWFALAGSSRLTCALASTAWSAPGVAPVSPRHRCNRLRPMLSSRIP